MLSRYYLTGQSDYRRESYEDVLRQWYYIDVKGNYKDGNKASKFNLIQKVLYHVKGIYVNRVIPSEFFNIAWVPDYYDSVFDNNFCYTKERNFAKKGYQPPVVRSNFKDAKTLNEWKELNL